MEDEYTKPKQKWWKSRWKMSAIIIIVITIIISLCLPTTYDVIEYKDTGVEIVYEDVEIITPIYKTGQIWSFYDYNDMKNIKDGADFLVDIIRNLIGQDTKSITERPTHSRLLKIVHNVSVKPTSTYTGDDNGHNGYNVLVTYLNGTEDIIVDVNEFRKNGEEEVKVGTKIEIMKREVGTKERPAGVYESTVSGRVFDRILYALKNT